MEEQPTGGTAVRHPDPSNMPDMEMAVSNGGNGTWNASAIGDLFKYQLATAFRMARPQLAPLALLPSASATSCMHRRAAYSGGRTR